jgi:hypothetical protein
MEVTAGRYRDACLSLRRSATDVFQATSLTDCPSFAGGSASADRQLWRDAAALQLSSVEVSVHFRDESVLVEDRNQRARQLECTACLGP